MEKTQLRGYNINMKRHKTENLNPICLKCSTNVR
jgi:hypothetical protein